MLSILDKAKCLTEEVLSDGAVAVDATLGNGRDAVHMVEHLRPTGHLYGIDVQREALTKSRERLETAGWDKHATLIEGDHANLQELLPSGLVGQTDAVMFNLGYLPGGNHRLITRPESTIPALTQAAELLRPGGRVTVVVYRGHEGGSAEYRAVMDWASDLDQRHLQVLHYRFLNQMRQPPELLAVERL